MAPRKKAERPNEGIKEAIRVAGSQYRLAQLLKVTQPAIQHFLNYRVTPERAMQIERLTGVAKSRIRPDIFDEG